MSAYATILNTKKKMCIYLALTFLQEKLTSTPVIVKTKTRYIQQFVSVCHSLNKRCLDLIVKTNLKVDKLTIV